MERGSDCPGHSEDALGLQGDLSPCPPCALVCHTAPREQQQSHHPGCTWGRDVFSKHSSELSIVWPK